MTAEQLNEFLLSYDIDDNGSLLDQVIEKEKELQQLKSEKEYD